MTKPTKLNIISKLNNFSNIQVGEVPTTFYDDNMYSLLYNKYGAVSLQKNDETYLSFTNDNAKIAYMQTLDSIKTKNIQLDCTILLTQIRAENILYAFVQGINNLFFKISIKNTFIDGIIITSNNMTISANYKFEANKKYNISISKEDDTYTFYINGISHGYKISPAFTNNIMAGQNITFGSNTGAANTSTSNFRGNLYNLNISYGATLINYKNYTKYGNHLISRQYFGNHNRVDTATLFYCNTETVNESPIVWEIPQINNKEEYAVLNNSLFKTKLNGQYTITFNLKPNNVSQTSNLFTYNNYRIILNIVVPALPDPDVTINDNTTAALNFENGIVDQVGTTIWQKEGTADVTSVNKIFGENSFETKALGDNLYTNNKLITGGSTPFTIEFYALIKGGTVQTVLPLITKTKNTANGDQGYYLNMNSGYMFIVDYGTWSQNEYVSYKIKPNELNKITITYDGTALRSFINDRLNFVVGRAIGFNISSEQPFRLFDNYIPAYSSGRASTYGIIDNINIHDGIATKVRDPDPYEEFLVVDLAFDGENNSTKIVDNGTLKSAWTVNGNAKLSTTQKFDGFSSLYLDGNGDYIYNNKPFNLGIEDFTISCSFISFSNDVKVRSIVRTVSSPNNPYSFYIGIENDNTLKFLLYDYDVTQALLNKSSNTIIQINKEYKFDVICKNNVVSMYINGIMEYSESISTRQDIIPQNLLYIGYSLGGSNDRYFNGYIKNFKIYKGVAVIPEDPTGKIQLDFDNNLNDKYGNSTWTNNGVTFDQVNSVKGHAAFIDGSQNKFISSGVCNNLNFENKNFTLEMDLKPTRYDSDGLLISSNSSRYDVTTSSYILYRENTFGIGCEVNQSRSEIVASNINLLSTYYNYKISRTNGCIFIYQNDVLSSMSPLLNTNLINLNYGDNTFIGKQSPNWVGSTNVNRYIGYIDNFKSYKEDLININSTLYVTNSNVNVIIDNDSLYTSYNGTPPSNIYATLVLNDSPILSNFIAEVELFIKSDSNNHGILNFRTSNYSSNNMDNFGYSAYISGNTIRFGKGSPWSLIASKTIPTELQNDDYHILKVIADGNNFKLFIDDILIIDANDSTYSIPSNFAWCTYLVSSWTGVSSRIKKLDIYDLENNLLYHKDFKSKIENQIDSPAVHLPLETNAINTGFTPLTINNVGNPTYTTVDGKKCIKFESGKYLTINSHNIFNFGNNSDFYIEFDFYIIDESILNVFLSNHTTFTNNSSCILYANKKIEFQFNNGTLKIYPTINTCEIGQFNNFKLYRMNNSIYMNLNGVETIINENYNINFSISNLFLGKSGWSSTDRLNGYMSNFKMFVGTSEIPETYNDKKVLDLDFKPTGKSYLFKDNNNKCIIHPVNITQRDYQDSQYCYTFNGTNQYLQLGKNDLLNFGLDDFVINIKFKINNFNNNWQSLISCGKNDSADNNKTAISINNNKIWVLTKNAFFIVKDLVLNSNTYYNLVVYRENTKYYLKLNDVNYVLEPNAVTDNRTELADYNYNNNTIIGANLWDGASGYFNGTIYSIKILRNTTDLSLLEDENTNVIGGETEVSYTLSNGFDEVSISKDTITEKSIQIVKDTNKVTAIIDDEILEVPTTAGNVDTNDLYLFNEYKGNIKDLRVYNKAFYDKDVFEYDGPYDTELGLIDTLDNEYEEYIMVDQGDYIIKGYFEGIAEPHKWRIYNSINYNVLITGTSINYYYNGVDHLYKDDYKILDMVTNKTYDIVDMGPPGSIKVFINSKVCTGSNFVIRAYRRDSGTFIGEYELDKTRDPYECTIHNLDTTKTYDIMLFDKNNNIESRVMSNRSPEAY